MPIKNVLMYCKHEIIVSVFDCNWYVNLLITPTNTNFKAEYYKYRCFLIILHCKMFQC